MLAIPASPSSRLRLAYQSVPKTTDRAQRLTRAFEAAQRDDGERVLPELRAATFSFVASLKSANLAPEQAVVALKSVLGSDGRPLSLFTANPYATTSPRHYAYRRVFAWSLDAYFGGTSDRMLPFSVN